MNNEVLISTIDSGFRQRSRASETVKQKTEKPKKEAELQETAKVGRRGKDITGERFGRLTALSRLDEKCGTSYVWLCRCDCGKEVKASVNNLKNGQVKSCGCLKQDKAKLKIKDIAGERFGKLTVIRPTDKRVDGGSVVWLCHCDCGKDTEVSYSRLRNGKVKSCGCLSNPPLKDWVGMRFGRLLVEEYAGKLNPNNTERYWKCRCDCGAEVNVGQSELQCGDTVSCGCYQKEVLRSQLKLIDNTSVAILERNRRAVKKTNKSGHTGVFQEKSGKWIAYINFKKKRYWLGRYEDKEDAIRAREKGEEMHEDFLAWYYSDLENRGDEVAPDCEKNGGETGAPEGAEGGSTFLMVCPLPEASNR